MTAAVRYFVGDSVRGLVRSSEARTFQNVVNALQKGATLPFSHGAFLALDEKQRNEAKQVPYFVAACFQSSPCKRRTDQATHCNLIFLDIDPEKEMRNGKWVETGRYPAARFVNDPRTLYTALAPFNFAAHFTASSTPEKPRIRVIVDADGIPLNEYPAVATAIGELLGLPSVTRESTVAVQPMFWPVRFNDSPADYQPVFAYRIDGRSFDVVDLLDSPSWNGSSSGSVPAAHLDDSNQSVKELENLRAPNPEISLEVAHDALSKLNPDCSRQEWIDVAAALKHQFSARDDAEAFELFDEWSSRGEKYEGKHETRKVWKSLRQTPKGRAPITIRTLLRRAEDAGWGGAITSAVDTPQKPRLIEFLSPSQVCSYEPPEGACLVGDFHLVRGAVTVIGGAPGVGKSRGLTQLAVSGATCADWFGLKVPRPFRTMIIQNENGRFRLKREFSALNAAAIENYVRVCPPPPRGFRFEQAEFREQIRAEIEAFRPDVIGIDPWNAAARDEKAKDYQETFDVLRSIIPAGDDGPALAIVAHTRKPRADERASGRALLNLLAGSYVLGSVPRSVFIMQAASDDTTDNNVVWTCCKNNDGEMGARSAWMRHESGFSPVVGFDWEEFDNAGKKGSSGTSALVRILRESGEPMTRAALVEAAMGCDEVPSQATVYRWIKKAEIAKAIEYSKLEETYSLP